ncbi:ribbon-helix-helix domain-containing protein [Thauera chlorobenzoica]|uniref:Uncharacterized protein n=1 Tax=Thauera chlorobenzoica TaxID=96773 RepID=A0A1H5XEN3_9RHOO|nr:ribbon-helix-helix domain-containing protein [Thauera chlorobenzoica]APR05537.1 hypothetical protein Tchl_2713 [Thauera chlorobenzoica]SEG10264.1 Ribbon-helix-helix domain-containing protein [Thauera chlorobenzoica]
MASTRWNVAVSTETDQALRMFLASQGGGRKGDLSRFIEEAVRAHILELSVEEAKAASAGVSEADLAAMVDEALDWARAQ